MSTSESESTSEIIDVITQSACSLAGWTPSVGPETLKLLANLKIPEDARSTVRDAAWEVFARCSPSNSTANNTTGLVVGYVQSGKTMSFTTVAALARDNGYRMVIVITGTSVPLLDQSTRRLQNDLQLDSRQDRKWHLFTNPSIHSRDQLAIGDTLAEWDDPTVPESERRTVLVTVMKNHRHLQNLIELLQIVKMKNVPTLVIDDEADQASLNTLVRQGRESTVYQRILSLRNTLPHHSFLQYTATPQAPLLINIIDVLSPDFAEILIPGRGYTGGKQFFLAKPSLVRTIPSTEIPLRRNMITYPPDSLQNAMRIFFLGVAAGLVLDGGSGNRSMLVHPSQKTVGHEKYYHWVTQIKETWKGLFELDEKDPARQELIAEFAESYEDLKATVPNLPKFEDLSARLIHAIRRTRVEEVNAARGKTPHINWNAAYGYILVGGQAMDRGFTIEGLTVTYMPRGLGVANADTVQQRARFFGYKETYAGYCRVFLENAALNAYQSYVIHEEDVREKLIEHKRSNKPLSEWKRAFFLTNQLKPTRASVLDLDYMRGDYSNDWFVPKAPHDSAEAVEANRAAVEQFIAKLSLEPDKGHKKRTEDQKHFVARVKLECAYKDLLVNLRMTRPNDSQIYTGVLLQIERYLETHPDEDCTVYQMKRGISRRRTVSDDEDEILKVFEGEYPDEGPDKGKIYPGDRRIRAPQGLTIQIHNLEIARGRGANRQILPQNVPLIAVYVPASMSGGWLVQQQDNQL